MTGLTRGLLLVGSLFFAAGVACGGGDGGGPDGPELRTVLVANNQFQPATLNVNPGDTVVWAWLTGGSPSIDHNIISTGPQSFPNKGTNVAPGSGTNEVDFFDAPESYQFVFNTAGSYTYFCSQHGTTGGPGGNTGMSGTVTVD